MVRNEDKSVQIVKHPRLVSAVEAFGITIFAFFTIIGFLNVTLSVEPRYVWTLSALLTLITFVSLYTLILGFRGLVLNRRLRFAAAIIPILLILFDGGAMLTVLLNGPIGPFGGAVEGISGPLTDGLLPLIPWPVSFVIGVLVAAILIHALFKTLTKPNGASSE